MSAASKNFLIFSRCCSSKRVSRSFHHSCFTTLSRVSYPPAKGAQDKDFFARASAIQFQSIVKQTVLKASHRSLLCSSVPAATRRKMAFFTIPTEDKQRAAIVYSQLSQLGISYKEYVHQAVMTVPEVLATLHEATVDACVIKNLFLKDSTNKFYLVSAHPDSEVDLKLIGAKLNAKKLRFANEDALLTHLNVKIGCVTPLAVSQDTNQEVRFIMDKRLKSFDKVLVHPLHNYATLEMKLEDLITYAERCEHAPLWIDLSGSSNGVAVTVVAENELNEIAELNISTDGGTHSSGSNPLGVLYKKDANFNDWYTEVIVKGEMIEYYDVSGCYIIRPWAFSIWETTVAFFDAEIKKLDVDNASFPVFVSKEKLETEKSHVQGFSPEVAWVTRYGDTNLAEPVAIRPTSETIMYPSYAKWIRSHRDLPLKLNLWNSVVRWEFKQPTPFIRMREFAWQEGHTVHATEEEALDFALTILELYKRWYEEWLAVPVLKGVKSEGEKFAGGKLTTTVESYVAETGRGIQAATSHLLGTNFAKMFGIEYEDEMGKKQLCHQTSWGCSFRSLGVMIMIHGDDNGLVLPPKVARYQVVVVPILYKGKNMAEILDKCHQFKKQLVDAGIRCWVDDRDNYSPGWKFNYWEMKGVPLRLEFGPKDLQDESVQLVRRDNFERLKVSWELLESSIAKVLENIQSSLLETARAKMNSAIVQVKDFKDVAPALCNKNLVLVPWCEDPDTEDEIRKESQRQLLALLQQSSTSVNFSSGMKCLCIPYEQPDLPEGTKCFWSDKPAKRWALWGRSY